MLDMPTLTPLYLVHFRLFLLQNRYHLTNYCRSPYLDSYQKPKLDTSSETIILVSFDLDVEHLDQLKQMDFFRLEAQVAEKTVFQKYNT